MTKMLSRRSGVLSLIGICITLLSCGPSPERATESPIPKQPNPAGTARQAFTQKSGTPPPKPTAQEVQQAVARVFGTTVNVDNQTPDFLVAGDFNGDDSVDLAVLVKPAPRRLSEINSSLANWIIQDPHRAFVPPKNQTVVILPPRTEPEHVRSGQLLLAVIHGFGKEGWRDQRARQAYLLSNAAGNALASARPSQSLQRDFGVFSSQRDVIAEQLGGSHGVLYWTGAAYAWHPESSRKRN